MRKAPARREGTWRLAVRNWRAGSGSRTMADEDVLAGAAKAPQREAKLTEKRQSKAKKAEGSIEAKKSPFAVLFDDAKSVVKAKKSKASAVLAAPGVEMAPRSAAASADSAPKSKTRTEKSEAIAGSVAVAPKIAKKAAKGSSAGGGGKKVAAAPPSAEDAAEDEKLRGEVAGFLKDFNYDTSSDMSEPEGLADIDDDDYDDHDDDHE